MEIHFKGKRTLVTGASQGIGRDLVKKLVKCGAKVVAVARNKDLLESLKTEVPSIEIFPADLSDWKKTEEVLNKIGDVDLLVNNAGLAVLGPLTEVSEEDIDRYVTQGMGQAIGGRERLGGHTFTWNRSSSALYYKNIYY